MNTSKHAFTAGPAAVSLYGSFRTLVRSGDEHTGRKIAITWVGVTNPKRRPGDNRRDYYARCKTAEINRARENEANAEFIADAFTVAHETGLTPRQLAERCKKLEAALREIVRCVRGGDETSGVSMDDALVDADDAIAKTGGA